MIPLFGDIIQGMHQEEPADEKDVQKSNVDLPLLVENGNLHKNDNDQWYQESNPCHCIQYFGRLGEDNWKELDSVILEDIRIICNGSTKALIEAEKNPIEESSEEITADTHLLLANHR